MGIGIGWLAACVFLDDVKRYFERRERRTARKSAALCCCLEVCTEHSASDSLLAR